MKYSMFATFPQCNFRTRIPGKYYINISSDIIDWMRLRIPKYRVLGYPIGHVSNIPTMQLFTRICRNTELKS